MTPTHYSVMALPRVFEPLRKSHIATCNSSEQNTKKSKQVFPSSWLKSRAKAGHFYLNTNSD
jgi:hypothetical protein